MLSEKRYVEVKNIFEEKTIELNEDEIILYADVFEIIAYYINDKLTTKEIIEAYDFLSDVILNKHPDIRVHVEKKDRIRVQVALMEKIPFIKNKLDLDEKIMLAFCIYLGACIQVFDEKTNEQKNGIVLFKSVESVRQEFDDFKRINPALFDIIIDNSSNENRNDFGYEKSNPVLTISVGDAYNYLSRLEYKRGNIEYSRIGSAKGNNGHILDIYKITVTKGVLFFKKSMYYTIYIDSYADSTSTKAPEPFTLK